MNKKCITVLIFTNASFGLVQAFRTPTYICIASNDSKLGRFLGAKQPQHANLGAKQPQHTNLGAKQPQHTNLGTKQPQHTNLGAKKPQNTHFSSFPSKLNYSLAERLSVDPRSTCLIVYLLENTINEIRF